MRSTSSIAGTPLNLAYVPGPVERFGRKLKVEYLGMASVYSIIALLYFGDLASWYERSWPLWGPSFCFWVLRKKQKIILWGPLLFSQR